MAIEPRPRSSTELDVARYFLSLPRFPAVTSLPTVVAVFGKGGSGKTTTATAVAAMASGVGHRVWLLDADPQGSALAWRARRRTGDLTILRCPAPKIEEAFVAAMKQGVDIVVIDNAPARHQYARTIAVAADLVLLTCGAAFFDLAETQLWVSLLEKAGVEPLVILGLALPRRQNVDAPFVQEARQALHKILSGHTARLWNGQITRRNGVVEALAAGLSAPERDPVGASAAEFGDLWRYLVRRMEVIGK
jgi:chromosome partitioning protein